MRQRNRVKPFVKWAGGKGQLLNTIGMLLPKELASLDEFTYIEPFVGGGAMLFYMLHTYPNIKRAVINDVNPNLIRAYNTIKNTPDELIRALNIIQEEFYNRKDEEERREYYLFTRRNFNQGNLSDIENTTLFIFLNRTCFNGLYRVNSKGEFNVPFGKYKKPNICDMATIYAVSEALRKVEIIQGDFEQIEKYIQPNTFIYFDPPYRPLSNTSSFNSYAKGAFNDEEQKRLKRFFDRLSNRAWLMLSNSDCAGVNPEDTFFDDLYKAYTIERVFAIRAINAQPDKRGKLSELLIRNFK